MRTRLSIARKPWGGHARTDGEGRERQSEGVDRLGRDGDGDRKRVHILLFTKASVCRNDTRNPDGALLDSSRG